MKCPFCGASANDYGVYVGGNKIHCLMCGVYYDYKTGEFAGIIKTEVVDE